MKLKTSTKWLIAIGATVLYMFVSFLLVGRLGPVVGAISSIPLMLIGWLLYIKGNLIFSVVDILWINILLYLNNPQIYQDKTMVFNVAIGGGVVIIVAVITGWIGQLNHDNERMKNELKTTNDELRQFIHVASHDLREPLRMIHSFVQLLFERLPEKPDKDITEFVGFITEGTQRMDKMITSLTQYSRNETQKQPPEYLKSGHIIQEALENLDVLIKESKAKITFGTLPTIWADKNQAVQLFQNFIQNAIKFQKKDNVPRIIISGKKMEEMIQFTITDNGIGMESTETDQIFEIFRRLNLHSEYGGTGIGLSICKKIVERHKGQIYVESTPGKGSTFIFTLPFREIEMN